MNNPYKIFGISRTADQSIARNRYIQLAKQYHPDTSKFNAKNSEAKMKEINRVISISNHSDLLSKQNIKLILKDVLNRFRNGGSHDKLISLETCEECISKLLNNKEDIGLITKFAKLNSEISDQKKERISE